MRRPGFLLVVCLLGATLAACQNTIPKDALELSQDSLQQRQLQSRRFDTANEAKLLKASAQVLQDLGFTIEDSETKLGVVVASKDRDAVETGQVVGAIVLSLLSRVPQSFDKDQKIKVSLITRPEGGGQTLVRVTFQRVVWNTKGQITKNESLDDPEMYQEFFKKLSESVFLTANEI